MHSDAQIYILQELLTVKSSCLVCVMPGHTHSDGGHTQELKKYLLTEGVAISNSMPYHPQDNGQTEFYIDVIWKTI